MILQGCYEFRFNSPYDEKLLKKSKREHRFEN